MGCCTDFYMTDKDTVVQRILRAPARVQIAHRLGHLMAELVHATYFAGPPATHSIVRLVPSRSQAFVIEGGAPLQDTLLRCLEAIVTMTHSIANDPRIKALLHVETELLPTPRTKLKIKAMQVEVRDVVMNSGVYCGYHRVSSLLPSDRPRAEPVPVSAASDLLLDELKRGVSAGGEPAAASLRAVLSAVSGSYGYAGGSWFRAAPEGWQVCPSAQSDVARDFEGIKETCTIRLKEAWDRAFDADDSDAKMLYGTCSRCLSNISHQALAAEAIALLEGG